MCIYVTLSDFCLLAYSSFVACYVILFSLMLAVASYSVAKLGRCYFT